MDAVEGTLREHLGRAKPDIVAAWLFGSVARGRSGPESDVDLAVLTAGDPPATLEGLHADLAAELGRAVGREVDVVVVNRASPDLVHRVLRDGKLLLDRDRSSRIAFEVAKRREYHELKRHLDRIRKRVQG